MNKIPAFLRYFAYGLLGLITVGALLFWYFIYSPEPEAPQLSGTLTKATIEVGGLTRTYRSYVPKGLPKGAPLLFVMHGSGQNGAQIRIETGYEFERLADRHGFAVVYPNARSFDWNDCSKVGDFSFKGREVDDVGFLSALAGRLSEELELDRKRVFATGVSSGGLMSLRLALEAPDKFRAVAAVSANLPAAENFKCKPSGQASSVMLMNGTKDPLVPYAGGESSLFGLFFKAGMLRSSRESADYFAGQNKISLTPAMTLSINGDAQVGRALWRNDSKLEVELVTIHGGGHGLPQAYWRRPRLLGPSPMAPNGAAIIWDFFAGQRP
ncbi:alpha/beta fold hydrolase [Undibacterium piscinae]|jgi:polyhydroxybutyrate depolymerase|uniref:Alpha/beta fold hydrolase n=1 Tax=Undibacterium piscinae TaxID=2495591 RepID=A0A6M4ABH3_9BURK|nr:alpha/beta fold hydrolase [Undibacterium piscinae]